MSFPKFQFILLLLQNKLGNLNHLENKYLIWRKVSKYNLHIYRETNNITKMLWFKC